MAGAGFTRRAINPDQVQAAQVASQGAPLVAAAAAAGQGVQPLSASPGQRPVPGGWQEGNTYEIQLGRIRTNPMNPRVIYTTAMVDDMVVSMDRNGQIQAVTAFVSEDGISVTIIDGETRLRAAKVGGRETLRVEIRPTPRDREALYRSAREANLKRNDHTPVDDAIRWKELLSNGVYPSQTALAKALDIGEDTVSRTLKLNDLPQRVIQVVMDQSGVSESTVASMRTLRMLGALREFHEEAKDEETTVALVHEVIQNNLGYREVVNRRKGLNKETVKRPRSTRAALTFGKKGQGELKAFEDRLELSIKGVSEAEIDDLSAKLKQVFGITVDLKTAS